MDKTGGTSVCFLPPVSTCTKTSIVKYLQTVTAQITLCADILFAVPCSHTAADRTGLTRHLHVHSLTAGHLLRVYLSVSHWCKAMQRHRQTQSYNYSSPQKTQVCLTIQGCISMQILRNGVISTPPCLSHGTHYTTLRAFLIESIINFNPW